MPPPRSFTKGQNSSSMNPIIVNGARSACPSDAAATPIGGWAGFAVLRWWWCDCRWLRLWRFCSGRLDGGEVQCLPMGGVPDGGTPHACSKTPTCLPRRYIGGGQMRWRVGCSPVAAHPSLASAVVREGGRGVILKTRCQRDGPSKTCDSESPIGLGYPRGRR